MLETGVSKSYMSKTFYLNSPSLHSLPTFVLRMKNILVGNGVYVGVLLVILVVIDIHRYRFELYTLASEMHDNVDIVIGITDAHDIEGIISTKYLCLHFLRRLIPFFPTTEVFFRPKVQRFIKLAVSFIDEISGLAMFKVLYHKSGLLM